MSDSKQRLAGVKERLQIRADICTIGAFEALIQRLQPTTPQEDEARQQFDMAIYERTGDTLSGHLRKLCGKLVEDARQMQADIRHALDRCMELEITYRNAQKEIARLQELLMDSAKFAGSIQDTVKVEGEGQ